MGRTIEILKHEQLINQTIEENVQAVTGMTSGISLTFQHAPSPCEGFELILTREELHALIQEVDGTTEGETKTDRELVAARIKELHHRTDYRFYFLTHNQGLLVDDEGKTVPDPLAAAKYRIEQLSAQLEQLNEAYKLELQRRPTTPADVKYEGIQSAIRLVKEIPTRSAAEEEVVDYITEQLQKGIFTEKIKHG
jgi:hypothetical protein